MKDCQKYPKELCAHVISNCVPVLQTVQSIVYDITIANVITIDN